MAHSVVRSLVNMCPTPVLYKFCLLYYSLQFTENDMIRQSMVRCTCALIFKAGKKRKNLTDLL